MVAEARSRIEEIDTEALLLTYDDPEVVVVDVRDLRERQRSGWIPGSFHAPRGMVEFWVDPGSPYIKSIFGEDRRFIFHCASGRKSSLTVATLQDMGFEAAHLTDGYSDRVRKDGPVEHVATGDMTRAREAAPSGKTTEGPPGGRPRSTRPSPASQGGRGVLRANATDSLRRGPRSERGRRSVRLRLPRD